MLHNRDRDMSPYDMAARPGRQSPLLLPLVWAACRIMTSGRKLQIQRVGMEGIKPPFLVLAEHQGFADYYIAPLALFPHRASYVSDVEGFAAFGDLLYRKAGCIPTRRFAGDSALIRNIRYAVEQSRDSVVVFPEARHSNVGTNSTLPQSVGKLVKLLQIPVAVLKTHGSYLTSPIWDEAHRRRVPLSATLELALTPEMIGRQTAQQITKCINELFYYDEYRWQSENRVAISYPGRADGLHKVLYWCPSCDTEFAMASSGSTLSCSACGKRWTMDEYGQLQAEGGVTAFPHIPDWYESQREQVVRQIREGTYRLHEEVRIEALPNHKGFVSMGTGTVEHVPAGFVLTIPATGQVLRFASRALPSVHTEYDYRGRGDSLVLSTRDCCYYLYFGTSSVNVTKIQFAAEHYHRISRTGMQVRNDRISAAGERNSANNGQIK